MPATLRTRTAGKKSKRQDNRPARKRYWMKRTLEIRKIKNLMIGFLHGKNPTKVVKADYDKAYRKAFDLWHRTRTTRIPDGFIQKVYS